MPNERTALHALHAELGARFTAFAGYDMPIQYRDGLRAEHLHTRAHAGLFDVSHMGQVRVTGPDLHRALERALPLDFDGWPIGAQRYSLLLNERTMQVRAGDAHLAHVRDVEEAGVRARMKMLHAQTGAVLERHLEAGKGAEPRSELGMKTVKNGLPVRHKPP